MNLISQENANSGSLDWQLTRIRLDKSDGFRTPFIEGYCSRQSVKAREALDIFVSTKPAAKFQLEIFRTGYYGGRGARLMTTLGPFEGKEQSVPEVGANRLRECRWEKTVSLVIAEDWISGVYVGRLTTLPESKDLPYWQSYIVFIVKDDRKADILLQCSDNTWQAYNRWPDTYSLYDSGIAGWVSGPDVDVSFDRPYGKYRQIYDNPQSVGSGEWLCFEFPLAYWLEQHGYDVSYCSNSDMITPERGLKCKAFISAGHDEYWDLRQYHSASAMRDAGVNLLFLSGNSVCWVTPFRDSSSGVPDRIITRDAPYGGLARQKNFEELKRFAGHTTGPDEGLLMGAINVIPVNGGGDWICAKPEHWIFAGTGMKKGEAIPGMIGWEYHGDPAKIEGLEVVAEGTAWQSGVNPQQWTATIYPGPKNNFVFNAATIWWAQGLSKPPGHLPPWSHWSRPHGPDARVQKITENLLKRAIG
ncbi:MAG: DUF6605 domain-containing protein [Prosthecobacter sp.]|nr:DUF6605 domain-containing protein [Prosthecobacter sp.]